MLREPDTIATVDHCRVSYTLVVNVPPPFSQQEKRPAFECLRFRQRLSHCVQWTPVPVPRGSDTQSSLEASSFRFISSPP